MEGRLRGRAALEGKGPQRWPQRRLGRRLEEVAEAVGGGYCRLQIPLRPALGVRGTVAAHKLGAREGLHPCSGAAKQLCPCQRGYSLRNGHGTAASLRRAPRSATAAVTALPRARPSTAASWAGAQSVWRQSCKTPAPRRPPQSASTLQVRAGPPVQKGQCARDSKRISDDRDARPRSLGSCLCRAADGHPRPCHAPRPPGPPSPAGKPPSSGLAGEAGEAPPPTNASDYTYSPSYGGGGDVGGGQLRVGGFCVANGPWDLQHKPQGPPGTCGYAPRRLQRPAHHRISGRVRHVAHTHPPTQSAKSPAAQVTTAHVTRPDIPPPPTPPTPPLTNAGG